MPETRRDFRKGDENKTTQRITGMRDLELGRFNPLATVGENIQIECARTPSNLSPSAQVTLRFFKRLP